MFVSAALAALHRLRTPAAAARLERHEDLAPPRVARPCDPRCGPTRDPGGAARDGDRAPFGIRRDLVRWPWLRLVRLYARRARDERLPRRLCSSLAAILGERTAARWCRRRGGSCWHDKAAERFAAGHVRRPAALLLRRRPETGPDPVPGRDRVRWRLACRASLWTGRPLVGLPIELERLLFTEIEPHGFFQRRPLVTHAGTRWRYRIQKVA